MVEMSKKNEKRWKWVKLGENPKMPYPQCGRSIKTYSQTTMIPLSPKVNGPGRVSSFERGGPLARGAMFLLSKGGSIDTRMGGPLTRILIENPKKFFVYAIFSLWHRCKRGGDQCFVPLASLWWLWSSCWPPFAIFACFYTFFCGAHHLFPMPFLHTYKDRMANTKKKKAHLQLLKR